MSDIVYNYRQALIHNSLDIQKNNTHIEFNSCCLCNKCNKINLAKINNIYTTEPSDLQLNYNTYFKYQSQKAKLNTHLI
jgi:hypothetical protein